MTVLDKLGLHLRTVRADALIVTGVLVALGVVFLALVLRVGTPGWYAIAWVLLLVLSALAQRAAQVLVPFGVLVWWASGPPVGTGYSLPAAFCLLGMFTCTALLSASPDGVPLSRAVTRRYLQRALVVAALTTGVWALGLLITMPLETTRVVTVVAFAALAVGMVAVAHLIRGTPEESA